MTTVCASAHPNIALVKYWGKQDLPGNLPAVPSLSITLDKLTATTQVSEAKDDAFTLNGKMLAGAQQDQKLARFLDYFRKHYDIPKVHIESDNNFPTAAGLASSAAGFAALVTALDKLFELRLNDRQKSALARAGSASAARSILGGFVGLTGPEYEAEQIKDAAHWPLHVVVAITDTAEKSVSSTKGMTISAQTSPYYPAWVSSANTDYDAARLAVTNKDFSELAQIAEHSCFKMHAVMQSSQPPLLYWNAASVACMQTVKTLREAGEEVFFTMDAGPQVKAVCTQGSADKVNQALAAVPGVIRTETVALGAAAEIVT